MNPEEPVRNAAIVKVLATVLVTLAAKYAPGLNLTPDQVTFVAVAALSVFTAVAARITRSKVTPTAKVARVAADVLAPQAHAALMGAIARKS